MIFLPPSTRVFIATTPTDMRRSFDGLAEQVRSVIGQNPYSGHLFLFRNRRGDRVKILVWDRSGFAIYYKRLEGGTFRLPKSDGVSAEIDRAELALILEGIELAGVRRQRRYWRGSESQEYRPQIMTYCARQSLVRWKSCRRIAMTETFFAIQQVRVLTRQRLATSRNRVLRGAGVTPPAKRTQGTCRPRDRASKVIQVRSRRR